MNEIIVMLTKARMVVMWGHDRSSEMMSGVESSDAVAGEM